MTELPPVQVKRAGPLAVIIPAGTLGQDSTGPLAKTVSAVLKTDIKVVAISMQDVSSLLSEGIRTIVTLRDEAADNKKDFHVCDLPVEVRYTLKITNLLEFLNHVNSLSEILSRYKVTAKQLKTMKMPELRNAESNDTDAPAENKKKRPHPHKYQLFGDED